MTASSVVRSRTGIKVPHAQNFANTVNTVYADAKTSILKVNRDLS